MAGKDKKKKAPVPVVLSWYYMCPEEVTVAEIQKVLDISDDYSVEIWPEAGVLEVEINEKASMDIEECELDMGDEFSNNFVVEVAAKSIFYVSYKKEISEICEPMLRQVLAKLGGRICADSEDFTPEIK